MGGTMAQQKQNEEIVQKNGDNKVKKPCAVLLWSSLASNAHQTSAQKSMNDKLKAHKVRFEQLDGAQGENKNLRNKLFNCSNVRGKYPQVFIVDAEDKLTYMGNDEDIQGMVDSETMEEAFKTCKKKDE